MDRPDFAALAASPLPWTAGSDPSVHPFVLFTRILCHRNFAGQPFPVSASPEACARLAGMASAFAASRGLGPAFRLADCGTGILRMLRERHLLAEPPVPLPGRPGVKFLALAGDGRAWAWINEVETLTWIRIHSGFLPARAFAEAYRPPGEDAASPWARSPRYGLLASDPGRVGPGVSFQLLVHLPALALARRLDQVHSALTALGAGFLPVTRRAMGTASLFWISSRGGMGGSAHEAYSRFIADVGPVLVWEAEEQRSCLEKHRKSLEDRAHQSLRRLEGAAALSYPDLQLSSSWAALGGYLGILDAQIPAVLEELRTKAQSGHLEVSSGRALTKEEEDLSRANVVRLAMERYRART